MESVPRGSCPVQQRGKAAPALQCSSYYRRHPVRYISFNSHSLITANVPYEKVLRNSDLDNFACHRRSVWGWAESVHPRHGCAPCSAQSRRPLWVSATGLTALAGAHTKCLFVCLQCCACSVLKLLLLLGTAETQCQLIGRLSVLRSLQMLLHKHCLLGPPTPLSPGVCISDTLWPQST